MLPYHSPEWVAAVARNYSANPANANKTFKGMSIFVVFGNIAEPDFGIDKPIYHRAHIEDGVLIGDAAHLSREEAEGKADFILTAPLAVWKSVIQKKEAFVSAFMTGRIKLEKGYAPKIIQLGPKSPALIETFNNIETEWPDEMSPERLEQYRAQMNEFRSRLGI